MDENNFEIFKHDFLALDTGTRALETDTSLRHYFSQTVAHNCVLVHKPGEQTPPHWGRTSDEPEAKICHGGQILGAANVLAFATCPIFSYVASDASPVYRGKTSAAVRQFLHVQPDFFVVYDRVDSTDATYRKEWLLHTQNEPVMDGSLLRADCGKGRIFCETLLPAGARIAKVGGPGHEFWASGKNWELDPKYLKIAWARAKKCGVGPYFGNWRIEVSPPTPAKQDRFLHVLTATDVSQEKPVTTVPVSDGTRDGVRLEIPGGSLDGKTGTLAVTCLFNRDGDIGAEVRCELKDAAGKVVATENRVLGNTVQKQSGVFPTL